MPPFVGRKRLSQSPLPSPAPPAKRVKTSSKPLPKPASKPIPARQKRPVVSFGDESSSSLSDVDSDEFEDVPNHAKSSKRGAIASDDDTDDQDWEDAPAQVNTAPDFSNREFKDVKIAVQKDEEPDFSASRAGAKKGPSRREKAVRLNTHKMHVQMLLWHNSIRNTWINDKKVQEILMKQLPSQIIQEIEKWKRASGLITQTESPKAHKDKKRKRKNKLSDVRSQRDWGEPSQKLEEGKADMSRGDPIITLLKVLVAYWRKRFAITAPGLRKRGYGTKLGLRQDIESYRNDKHNPARHGERIRSLLDFRKMAENGQGSRDAGAQLFTALLRGIGIEARMVASLQPAGYGFTKAEQMAPRKTAAPLSSLDSSDSDAKDDVSRPSATGKKPQTAAKDVKGRPQRKRGEKAAPINLDTDVDDEDAENGDDASIIDVTPSMPKARAPKFDQDLAFPVYWTEAISPITAKVFSVCPLVLETPVATSAEALSLFEPRGAKAEKAKQVIAYVAAYSADRTAKDVTVRYLRKNVWPGKTKGFRIPIEKIPVYDDRGSVRKTEEYDWFKHVMSVYTRSDAKRTATDDLEDATDLVPAAAEKKEVDIDTLQGLKASTEFVLERHLRREEALVPGSKPVRSFVSGKGDKQTSEPVYKRSDVVRVATAESWHKEGRSPKEGELPIKLAPVRAVTLARKREAEEHQIRTGEKQMQGLYSEDQTDWIIPPPIENGVIPKNSYGNIDCFVPSMIPRGAVHLPLKGSMRICKKLEIDFAEAVIGFEFGNRMAIPMIQGVVVAKENEKLVWDAWREWNEEQRKKEESKMERLVLDLWRKFVLGLRIRARVQDEYTVELDGNDLQKGATKDEPMVIDDEQMPNATEVLDEEEFGGGFLPESEDEAMHGTELVFHDASQEEPKRHQKSQPRKKALNITSNAKAILALNSTSRTHESKPNGYVVDKSDSLNGHESGYEDGGAGGFFADSEEPVGVERPPIQKPSVDSSPPVSDNNDESEYFSEPVQLKKKTPRRNGASLRKANKTSVATTPKSNGTRSTPVRNAKGKAKIALSAEAEDTGGSEEEETTAPVPDATRTTKKCSRGRPRKSAGAEEPKGKRKLLRKESTLVSSPYFEQD